MSLNVSSPLLSDKTHVDPDQFKRANVIVTSYSIVASEFSAYRPDAKDEGKNKSKKKTENSDDDSSDQEQFGRTIKATKKKGVAPKKKDALFRIKWWRIVLGMPACYCTSFVH